jgi:integrase
MPVVSLSAEFVRTVVCPEGKAKENYYDTAITGFILEVRSTGGKTYALRYKDDHGRQIQHKIGDAKSITFDKAKNAAKVLRSKVVLGEDPSENRRVKRLVPTLAEFTADRFLPFIQSYKRSYRNDESFLRNHILPKFGALRLDEIGQQAIIDFHHSMKVKGYSLGMANKEVILLKYMFNLAIKWSIPGVKVNPAVGVKLYKETARERYLTADETQRLLSALEKSRSVQLKYIVSLLLLLGCRKRELLDSRWSDFDSERRNWRIPMSKSGKARHVPLSMAAIEILSQLPRWEGCPYVIPNPRTLLPFVQIQRPWDNVRKAAGLPDVRIHDLRHSMASNMVNSGQSLFLVSKVLGHTTLRMTERYAHLNQETLLAAVDAAANHTGTTWGQIETEAP